MNMNYMKTQQEQEGSGNEGQDSDHNNADVDIQPPTTVRIDKIADTITNHGELNVVNNKVISVYCRTVFWKYLFANTTLDILFLFLLNRDHSHLQILPTTLLSLLTRLPPHW